MLRQECIRTQRRKTRTASRKHRLRRRAVESGADFDNARAEAETVRSNEEHRDAKRRWKIVILKNKKKCWTELKESVERDPFGYPYKMVMSKLRGGPPTTVTMEPQCLRKVNDTLFPTHDANEPQQWCLQLSDSVLFLTQEVNNAIDAVRAKNKAPRPDGIASRIIWAVHEVYPYLFPNIFNYYLYSGVFPTRWKEARVVLLRKGTKPEGVPSSYRPLCLLNDVGKVLERLLNTRLQRHINLKWRLAPNQFGYG